MRIIFLLLLLLAAGRSARAQLSGWVTDQATVKGLPYVTLRLLQDKRLLRTAITDSSGSFHFRQLLAGRYTLQSSIAGYDPAEATFDIKDSLRITIQMKQVIKNLEGVTVTTQRPLVTALQDGFLYDAARDVQMAGETAGDLLRKLPGVQVDPAGLPSMRGSTRIKIFIDDMPAETYAATSAEALRLVSADNIARVEIITQPSARYDGEGVDGVINIYTKKRLSDGVSGNVNAFAGTRGGHFVPAMIIRKRNWLINSDAGYYGSGNETITFRQRKDKTGGNDLDQYQLARNKARNIVAGTTLTRIIDSLTTASLGVRYGNFRDNIETGIDYTVYSQGSVMDQYSRAINNKLSRWNYNFNLAFSKKSRDKTGELYILGYYFNQQIRNDYSLEQRSYTESNDNRTGNREAAFQADYTKKGKQENKFETGIKGAFRRFKNTSVFTPDQGRSEEFYFLRDILSIYSSYSFNMGKWKARIGARYEHTLLSIQTLDTALKIPDYRNFLPNLLLSRSKDASSFSLAYSRRISRPYLNALNPVVSYIDSLNLSYGNPYLDPAISNNFDLTYTYNKGKWLVSANLFFYQTIRSIEYVTLLKGNGIVERTYQNVSRNNAGGLFAQLTFRGKKLSINTNYTLRRIEYSNGFTYQERSGWVLNAFVNANYKLTPTLLLNASTSLNTRRIDFQGSTTGTRYYVFMVNKTFKEGKYAFNIRLDNLFMPFQTIREFTDNEAVSIISDAKQIRRFFRVAFNYKFGKKEIRETPVRTIGSDN
ncbi:MAG TPA: outer membrane beta-barrel family protein [Chitinophagaceae bacterium]|jgi:outer membrane receptor protein involved in Fe transport|nr:outer membrane beta-barrel family protein [Chitinophagaceae bacterium]